MRNIFASTVLAFSLFLAPLGLYAQDARPVVGKPAQVPPKPTITNPVPDYLDYEAIAKQFEEWSKQAPGLTEMGTYGKSTKGLPLRYFRVTNLLDTTPKKKVLVHACIHGNEPWATSTTMAFIGTMLSEYGTEKETTDLINTRDIYFVPVLSPDTYPKSRTVDKVDPNRNYPDPRKPNHKSVTPIHAIQKFFLEHKFNAVLSGHTFGRWYWAPFADSTVPCIHIKDYDRILGEMQAMNRYGRWYLKNQKAAEYGTEVDWYYRNGAFAIGCEYGTHQKRPLLDQTKTELANTYKPFLYFLREGPMVVVPAVMTPPKVETEEKEKTEK